MARNPPLAPNAGRAVSVAPELTTADKMRERSISSRAEALTPVLVAALETIGKEADAGALIAAVRLASVPTELHDVLGAALEKLGYKITRTPGEAALRVRW